MKKETENLRTVCGMLEELKQTWENALMKLLKEYQSEHPDDKDLQNAMAEIEGKSPAAQPQVQMSAPAVKKAPVQTANAKPRSFSLAG